MEDRKFKMLCEYIDEMMESVKNLKAYGDSSDAWQRGAEFVADQIQRHAELLKQFN